MLHDLLVCGINEPGFRSRCPGCQREEEEESLRKLAILKEARQLREELDLPRDPCVLDRRRRAEVLLWLLDIRKTAQEHPDWAQSLQAVVMHILPRKT